MIARRGIHCSAAVRLQMTRPISWSPDVKYLYADPYHWETDLQRWSAQWEKQIITFPTNIERRMDAAIARFLQAIKGGLTHDGDPIFAQHIRAAALAQGGRKQPRPEEDISVVQHYLKVVKKRQSGHIDTLIAGILAEEARGKAIEDGALNDTVVDAVWR